AARGGQPILPRSLLRLPGLVAGLGGLFATMAVFTGWLFSLTLPLAGRAAGRAHVRPLRGRVRPGQPQLAAAAGPLPRRAGHGGIPGRRARAAVVGGAAVLRRRRRPAAV